jgi:hypothetical protein
MRLELEFPVSGARHHILIAWRKDLGPIRGLPIVIAGVKVAGGVAATEI